MLLAFLLTLLPWVPAATLFAASAEEEAGHGFTGFTGFAADVIDAMGEVGVGVLSFVEVVFPPIPSEIVLSLAGFLAERGQLNLPLVIVTSTVGSVAGAVVLYGLGAWFGEERAKQWLTKLPLVEASDFDKASRFFHNHGRGVVFFGRFVPIVRSLVSLPAGGQGMPLLPFLALTSAGSLIWNTVLIMAGYGLGTQFEKVDQYANYLDYAVAAVVIVLVLWWLGPRVRRRLAA
ncbi:MAG: DedA family protein [Dehalococcoidia bacterium]